MKNLDLLIRDLPDPESATRFLGQFTDRNASHAAKLRKNDSLLLDVLTLASFSPLLAATMLQNPEYLLWLDRKRANSIVRNKEELLESLARFSLTNSRIELNVQLARFRRRELLRIFLRDIRRLATIAEVTEEISNLADAILEHALRIARQELDNRYGAPFQSDKKGRGMAADVSIVSLGKLGSKELNYSSDIDLLFIYSDEGETSGASRGAISNREYFAKLAETVLKLVGRQTGEGAAYRVDLRLRPHGRVGPLAMPMAEISRYYNTEAALWERQVLIRSRVSAGCESLFKQFLTAVEDAVFSPNETVENALENVRRSKQNIDLKHISDRGFDVKLGRGGIREIEFIAQALQLAYGGRDRWLRAPHTLISLVRLADRKLISESDLTDLFDAYEFLRRTEHRLQMENGLQTHTVPRDETKRAPLAGRMGFADVNHFDRELERRTNDVNRVFRKIFEPAVDIMLGADDSLSSELNELSAVDTLQAETPLNKNTGRRTRKRDSEIERITAASWRAAAMIAAYPELRDIADMVEERDYAIFLHNAVNSAPDFGSQLAELRRSWTRALFEIIAADVNQSSSLTDIKRRQTKLAEASIEAGLMIAKRELERRCKAKFGDIPIAILGLGKLGGGTLDYDSDLDLVIAYDDSDSMRFTETGAKRAGEFKLTAAEFYSRLVEIFISALSAMTREGSLYCVDLRLRPYGKDGAMAIRHGVFADYMKNESAIWELLAFVKLRAVGGDMSVAKSIENDIRGIVHSKACGINKAELAAETRIIRERLERQKSAGPRRGVIDIKYGEGGMLDVYFTIRFLQLRDNIPDAGADRSTIFMLKKLFEGGSLTRSEFDTLGDGYGFLSRLDHILRLTVGRQPSVQTSNMNAVSSLAERLELDSATEFLDRLTTHRINIRGVFNTVVG